MRSTLKYILTSALLVGGVSYILKNFDFITSSKTPSVDEEVVTAEDVSHKKISYRAPASPKEVAPEFVPVAKQEKAAEQLPYPDQDQPQENSNSAETFSPQYQIPANSSYSAPISSTTQSNTAISPKTKPLPIAVADSKKRSAPPTTATATPKPAMTLPAKTAAPSVSSTTVTPTPTPTATPTPTPTVPPIGMAVLSNTASGTYTFARPFVLTFYIDGTPAPTEGSSIYCTTNTPGDPCCDPTNPANSGHTSVWTATTTIGNNGNGSYCVSFYGEHTASASTTAVTNLSFQIDSTAPAAPQVATETMVVQTTETYNVHFTMGNDPLLSMGQSLSFYRLTPDELSSASNNCGNIVHDYLPLDLNGDGTPDTVDLVSYLMSYLDVLIYGSPALPLALNYTETNYVISVATKPNLDTPLNTCSITPIIVKDFEVFSDQPAYRVPASDASGSTLMGGFNPYSFFEGTETATGSSVGEGRFNELRSNFLNIIH